MNQVKESIGHEMKIFNEKFSSALKSKAPLLDSIMKFIVRRKGKQVRPMFVLLSAKLCGKPGESTYRAASLVELLHTATLVHDDVVDDSMERRGFFSVNAIWKNKVAVLVGDYLLSRGLLLATEHKEFMHLHILSEAVKLMSEGELLQIEKTRKLNLDEDLYFDIIRKKTASLIASACAVGAYSTTNNEEITEKMRIFGEKVGIAFQIKDDLLDYGNGGIGKPTKNDIKEKKLTLPLIHAINKADKALRKKMVSIVLNNNQDIAKVDFVLKKVKELGGMEYAEQKMIEYRNESIAILHGFPDSPERRALEELVNFTTNRPY